MSRWSGLAALALLAPFVSPAAAQAPEEYRKLDAKAAARELAIYSECLASRRTVRARALALAPYGSAEQAKAADNLSRSIDEDCIQSGFDSVRLTVRGDVLAGAVADVLLDREYPDLPVVIDASAVDAEAERARAAALSVAERFGRCVVWNDPAGVQALLRADQYSSAERQAIEALKPDMGMCLQEGSTLRLERSFVRNVAAVSAYRLAQQIRPRARGTERG